ncbi:MAG TPA: zf-HC2 domain-containing protein [Pyrinomonadaceae bacterium]|nr:zf-HC2 domain-containing protein [Pyrinomonadaceae bacterium]
MKQEKNNEIDLLLRRLGRRADGGVSDPDGGHLDADELSSYAENALPPSARSRYTEHLAQCSSCRTLVVQLSSAAGVVVAPERAMAEPSGFMKFLASLFSPLVLRYAIPALGLAVIAVIGLTVFRPDGRQDTDVAQRTAVPAPPNEQSNAPAAGAAPDQRLEDAQAARSSTPDAGSVNMTKAPSPAPTAVDKISPPVSDTSGAAIAQAPPAPKLEVQPVIANTPAPSPTPAAAEINERKVEVPVQKQQVQGQVQSARERDYAARDESRRAANEAAPATASATQSAPGTGATARPQKSKGTFQSDGAGEKDRDDAETRTIAGRRFRKQGGVWVDTAYESSSETTNLTRGSERYRAVVADEPTIKIIADQLNGEIIVVWKGRPYRIR